MKKFIKVFPVLSLLIIITLFVMSADLSMKEKYTRYYGFNLSGINFNKDSFGEKKSITDIYEIAVKNKVIMVKTQFDLESNITKLYLSTENISSFFSKYFNLTEIHKNPSGFIATFYSNNEEQSYYLPDFLRNDKFEFHSLLFESQDNIYKFGDYSIYSNDESNYSRYISEVSEYLEVPAENLLIENWGQLNTKSGLLFIAILVCIIVFSLTFFLVTVFSLYRESKKIGTLQLLGFNSLTLIKIFIRNNLNYVVFTTPILILLSTLLPNITINYIFSIIFLCLFLIIISAVITAISILIVIRKTAVSNVIKNESLTNFLTNISMWFKVAVTITFVFLTVSLLPSFNEFNANRSNYLGNKIVNDYAVFPSFKVDNDQSELNENFLKFYRSLKDSNVDYLYSDFRSYTEGDSESNKYYEDSEKNGTAFRIAVIDEKYVVKYEIDFYDQEGKQQNGNYSRTFYLFPKSKASVLENFIKKMRDYNIRLGIESEPLIYYYDDSIYSFDTFAIYSSKYHIESPFIRVIGGDLQVSYIDSFLGIDVVGTGMNTALKFDIQQGKQETYAKLEKYISSSNLSIVIPYDNFTSYGDYLGTQNAALRTILSVLIIGLSLISLIYLFVIIQIFSLYFESHSSQINVKILLGYKKYDIFRDIIIWSSLISIVPIIAFCLLLTYFKYANFLSVCIVGFSFIVIDIVSCALLVKFINMSKIKVKLKGGD